MLNSKVIGYGKYIPEQTLSNDDLSRMVDTSDEWIVQRTGIRSRRIVLPGVNTSDMATAAAKQALERANFRPEDIELIIVATSSPDYLTPPVCCQVQHQLGATRAGALSMVLGCSGFVAALITAEQFIRSGAYKSVLVIGAELMSRSIDWTDRNTCVLFGDGAGALLLTASSEKVGLLSFLLGSDGSGAEHLILPAGGTAIPIDAEALAKKENYLKMNGTEVFKFASRVIVDAIRKVLSDAKMDISEVSLLIPHQANERIIEAACSTLGLSEDRVFLNISNYGNTSAASVAVALCEAIECGRAKPGDTLALVAFGAGLSWASAIYKL